MYKTIKKQYYGIKFPFTNNNANNFFLDLNIDKEDKYASEILHTILTPKGTRIRMPEFGTDLIKFIFSQNDEEEWADIKEEIIEAVSKYVTDVTLKSIDVSTEEDNNIYVDMIYTYQNGSSEETVRLGVKL